MPTRDTKVAGEPMRRTEIYLLAVNALPNRPIPGAMAARLLGSRWTAHQSALLPRLEPAVGGAPER